MIYDFLSSDKFFSHKKHYHLTIKQKLTLYSRKMCNLFSVIHYTLQKQYVGAMISTKGFVSL